MIGGLSISDTEDLERGSLAKDWKSDSFRD